MYEIKEIKTGKMSKYVLSFDNGLTIKKVVYPIFNINKDGKTYWVLYDDKMKLIGDFFSYINIKKLTYSNNTYKAISYQLRLLYIFCACFGCDIKKLTHTDLIKLGLFLNGESSISNQYRIELLTRRSRTTVLKMFSTYRDYIKYSNYDDSAFNILKPRDIVNTSGQKERYNIRRISELNDHYVELPKFISHKEYLEIIKLINTTYEDKELMMRDKSIINLMYEAGCRIGEVLGLTYEDIRLYKTKAGIDIGVVKIRNRVSDKLYQCAKTCMKVKQKSEYKKHEYNTINVGFQETYISLESYKIIMDYISISHGNNDNKLCEADKVDDTLTQQHNEYIFLDKRFKKPLSVSIWNVALKKLFVKAGISIDISSKKDGLNHRFRHGFAMRLLYECKYSTEMVQKRMRHKNIASTMIYNNPTIEQIIGIKQKFEDERLNTENDFDKKI